LRSIIFILKSNVNYVFIDFFVFLSPLTVAAGHPLFENSEKIQRCLTPKAFGGVRWISELRK